MGRVTERLDPQPGLSQEINGTRTRFSKMLMWTELAILGEEIDKTLEMFNPLFIQAMWKRDHEM